MLNSSIKYIKDCRDQAMYIKAKKHTCKNGEVSIYYYLMKTIRINKKPTPKVIKYLGKKLVRILKELLARGSFTNEGNVDDRKNRYEYYSNPLKTFIEENYERVNESYVPKIEFNESFREFLNNNGYRSMTEIEINKGLASIGFEIKTKRIGDSTSKVIIDLKEKEEVTNVTNVTSNPTQLLYNKNCIENPVTTVTPVTNIKEWVIKILTQYKNDLEKRSTANIVELLKFNLKVSESEATNALSKMSKDGLIHEVKHDHWGLI